jgi:hypothetical protein
MGISDTRIIALPFWSIRGSFLWVALNLCFNPPGIIPLLRETSFQPTNILISRVSFSMHLVSLYSASLCYTIPTTELSSAGAHIGFAGAVWTDKPHIQVLAPVLPLFYHATDTYMRARAARYFGAAKNAIRALKHYYYEVEQLDPANHRNAGFPFQTDYIALADNNLQEFTYLRAVDDTKLVFQCKAVANGSLLCVKFVRSYSKEAHLKSASLAFAPPLRGFQSIGGDWFMVVMDWVGIEYQLLDESPMKEQFFSEVKDKLALLHQAGYVHGDIRPSNIMVRKDGKPGIIFLDFDWAGVIGEVRYPMNINNVDICRPPHAVDAELIWADHDIQMADLLPSNM